MIQKKTDGLAKIADERVSDISKIRGVLWTALATLFENGAPKDKFGDSAKDKANLFAKPFEQVEDARFFDGPLGLNEEIESEHPENIRLNWYLDDGQARRGHPDRRLRGWPAQRRTTLSRPRRRLEPLAWRAAQRKDPADPGATTTKTQKDAKETTHVQP